VVDVAGVVLHVAEGVHVDERADERDEEDERDRERVEEDPRVELERAGRDPRVEDVLDGPLLRRPAHHREKERDGEDEARPGQDGREERTEGVRAPAAEEEDRSTEQRQPDEEPGIARRRPCGRSARSHEGCHKELLLRP
jgi:hypothetical protein